MTRFLYSPFPDLNEEDISVRQAISAEPWSVESQIGNIAIREQAVLPGWDYGVLLSFKREMILDSNAIMTACGLGERTVVLLSALWGSGGDYEIRERSAGARIELIPDQNPQVQLAFTVPGHSLAGRLNLATYLVLEKSGNDPCPGAASTTGSILWNDEATLELEGSGNRVSIVIEDFKDRYGEYELNASWTIGYSSDWLSMQQSAGLQIAFNSRHERVLAAVRRQHPGTEDKLIRSSIRMDIGRQVLIRALSDEIGFKDDIGFEPGTVGASLKILIGVVFKHMTIDQIRDLQHGESDRFERLLQAYFGMPGALS